MSSLTFASNIRSVAIHNIAKLARATQCPSHRLKNVRLKNSCSFCIDHNPRQCPRSVRSMFDSDFTSSSWHNINKIFLTHVKKCSQFNIDNNNQKEKSEKSQHYVDASDSETRDIMLEDFIVCEDFVTEKEEEALFNEIEPYLRRLRYETDHWDNAIHGYRETERKQWTEGSQAVITKIKDFAFPPECEKIAYTHVLDLQKTGYIKAHIDSPRFCGDTIAGLSLLSSSVMRLVNDKNKDQSADILLKRRSLYIMKGKARYDFTHEVLGQESSVFKGDIIERDRRISIVCRDVPRRTNTD